MCVSFLQTDRTDTGTEVGSGLYEGLISLCKTVRDREKVELRYDSDTGNQYLPGSLFGGTNKIRVKVLERDQIIVLDLAGIFEAVLGMQNRECAQNKVRKWLSNNNLAYVQQDLFKKERKINFLEKVSKHVRQSKPVSVVSLHEGVFRVLEKINNIKSNKILEALRQHKLCVSEENAVHTLNMLQTGQLSQGSVPRLSQESRSSESLQVVLALHNKSWDDSRRREEWLQHLLCQARAREEHHEQNLKDAKSREEWLKKCLQESLAREESLRLVIETKDREFSQTKDAVQLLFNLRQNEWKQREDKLQEDVRKSLLEQTESEKKINILTLQHNQVVDRLQEDVRKLLLEQTECRKEMNTLILQHNQEMDELKQQVAEKVVNARMEQVEFDLGNFVPLQCLVQAMVQAWVPDQHNADMHNIFMILRRKFGDRMDRMIQAFDLNAYEYHFRTRDQSTLQDCIEEYFQPFMESVQNVVQKCRPGRPYSPSDIQTIGMMVRNEWQKRFPEQHWDATKTQDEKLIMECVKKHYVTAAVHVVD